MKKLILITHFTLLTALSFGQLSDSIFIRKLVTETMTNGTAYSNLRTLCKQVGPRLSGSPQFLKSVKLVSQMMKAAGADSVFLQECKIPHWVRGSQERGHLLLSNGNKHILRLTALGTSIGTGKKGIMAGVIEVKSMDELSSLGSSVKGKIVFFNLQMNPTYINTFQAYGESGIARRAGAAQASKYGAIAVMVRSLAINLNDYPHTGVMRYSDSFPKIPAVAISTNDAEYLSQALKKGNVSAYLQTNCTTLPDAMGYNVVGEIHGSEIPGEIITVGGHLDSWDLAEGANDDGSGVVQSIEVLRTLRAANSHPKRTVRAVAFANEEITGTGAKKYFEMATANHEKHIFALESDAGGFTPRGFSLDMTEAQQNKVNAWKLLFYPYGVYNFVAGGSGSDVGDLKQLGAACAGLSPDTQRYFDIHHASTDVFENVSERELKLGAANMAVLIWLVSEYGIK